MKRTMIILAVLFGNLSLVGEAHPEENAAVEAKPVMEDRRSETKKEETESPEHSPENTLDSCRDGRDNDQDEYTDCDDQDCWIYAVCVGKTPADQPEGAEEKTDLQDTIHRPFSVGFVPGLTTDTGIDGVILNNFTLNAIGMGDTLKGAEFSWFGAIRKYDMTGLQLAGTFNHVQGTATGFQGAGIYNYAHQGLKGFQGAGIASVTGGRFTGFRAAGIGTVAIGDVKGFSGAGIANFNHGTGSGFSGAGIANVTTGNYHGFQGAGIANYSGGTNGAQIAGIANVAAGEMRGLQVGLVNFGTRVTGAQIGLVNIATKEMKGAPIGLVNFAGDGILAPVFWGSDTSPMNLALQMGSKYVYGILGWGCHPGKDERRGSLISGLGGHVDFDPGWLEIDLITHWIYEDLDWNEDDIDMMHKLRITAGFRPVEQLSLFAGPTLNLLVSEVREDMGPIPTLATYRDGTITAQLSVGFIAGLKWEPRLGELNRFGK